MVEGQDFEVLSRKAVDELEAAGFKKDYFNIANPITLEAASAGDSEYVILAAAYLGNTRLIDNISVTLEARS